jgi:D-alanine-D-alanine ligase
VAVLSGGRSSERDVSLVSGRAVAEALRSSRDASDRRGPARVIEVEIEADGRWLVGGEALAPGLALARLDEVDLFFNGLHGGEGENGALQGLFACSDRVLTGTGVAGSALCMDKVFGRALAGAHGLRVAPGVSVSRSAWSAPRSDQRAAILAALAPHAPSGLVVKPRCGGSSLGCAIVREAGELEGALLAAFEWEEEALVEARIAGAEASVAVLVDAAGEPRALPPIEIRPKAGRFFDYEEKYSAGGADEICPAVSFRAPVLERLCEAAVVAHRALACAGYSRSDFIVEAEGVEPVFLETNTLPGLTPRSLLPRAALAAGIDYRTLCLAILEDARRRAGERRAGERRR